MEDMQRVKRNLESRKDLSHASGTIRVDLHLHSDKSDGYYPPEVLPNLLVSGGVKYASLTDHQTVTGLSVFSQTAEKAGIPVINGLELHGVYKGKEIHLLAYGFDPKDSNLPELFRIPKEISEAIETVHKAGGLVFLAHPLGNGWRGKDLEEEVKALVQLGLDGIEAFYGPYSLKEQEALADLADRLGLLTSGGSDFHRMQPEFYGIYDKEVSQGSNGFGVLMPLRRWKQFRDALGNTIVNKEKSRREKQGSSHLSTQEADFIKPDWPRLTLYIALPSVLVLITFIVLLFAVMIPTMEQRLLDRKREMVRELTNSAWSIVYHYNQEVEEGKLDLQSAQASAIERLRYLRYGFHGMDYFWITNMQPIMIMHPYRPDLEGVDLSNYTDPQGVKLFIEFVKAVTNHTSGFVTYVWQWQDDPDRLMAKESYVRGFEPWGWIIGTGLYFDDVRSEIQGITGKMIDLSFLLTLLVFTLLSVIIYYSIKTDKKRMEAEGELILAYKRYQALVESSRSGTLLIVDGRCTYANTTFLELTGYSSREIVFLDFNDLFISGKGEGLGIVSFLSEEQPTVDPSEVNLKLKNGTTLPVLLSVSRAFFSGKEGLLINLQDLSSPRKHKLEKQETGWESFLFSSDPYAINSYNESSPLLTIEGIKNAGTVRDLTEVYTSMPALVDILIRRGVRPEASCEIISKISDSITERLLILAQDKIGKAPSPFIFVALGSEARREQTLATDQDNAIIFLGKKGEERDYFLTLGEYVCDSLESIGFRYCKGGNMAMNPKWNKPLEEWVNYFQQWIREPNREALAHCNVFFDWRSVYGDTTLLENLKNDIRKVLKKNEAFLSHMAMNTLNYKPPIGLFGQIITGAAGEKAKTFNIKEAILPIVNFARLYALKEGLEETNTLKRLELLHTLGLIKEGSFKSISEAYRYLMMLRFSHQLELWRLGLPLNNSIDPRKLTKLERGILRLTFSEIGLIQKRVSFQFKGSAL